VGRDPDLQGYRGALEVPLGIARELIRECVQAAPLRNDGGAWIGLVITSLLGIAVEGVAVHESPATEDTASRRYFDVTVVEADAPQFRDAFPEARKLMPRSGPGSVVFRLRC
jgi:hypothetical protein